MENSKHSSILTALEARIKESYIMTENQEPDMHKFRSLVNPILKKRIYKLKKSALDYTQEEVISAIIQGSLGKTVTGKFNNHVKIDNMCFSITIKEKNQKLWKQILIINNSLYKRISLNIRKIKYDDIVDLINLFWELYDCFLSLCTEDRFKQEQMRREAEKIEKENKRILEEKIDRYLKRIREIEDRGIHAETTTSINKLIMEATIHMTNAIADGVPEKLAKEQLYLAKVELCDNYVSGTIHNICEKYINDLLSGVKRSEVQRKYLTQITIAISPLSVHDSSFSPDSLSTWWIRTEKEFHKEYLYRRRKQREKYKFEAIFREPEEKYKWFLERGWSTEHENGGFHKWCWDHLTLHLINGAEITFHIHSKMTKEALEEANDVIHALDQLVPYCSSGFSMGRNHNYNGVHQRNKALTMINNSENENLKMLASDLCKSKHLVFVTLKDETVWLNAIMQKKMGKTRLETTINMPASIEEAQKIAKLAIEYFVADNKYSDEGYVFYSFEEDTFKTD